MIDAITGLVNEMWGVIYYTPDFIDRIFAYLIELYMYLQFKAMLATVKFMWGIASVIVSDFGISGIINSAISTMSPAIGGWLAKFGIFDGIHIIMTASVTRFTMDFTGLGR